MTWESIQKRLALAETVLKPNPIMVEYFENGNRTIITADELLTKPNDDFTIVKVVSGNNVKDLKKILDWESQSKKCFRGVIE